jgi:hypothetical protein
MSAAKTATGASPVGRATAGPLAFDRAGSPLPGPGARTCGEAPC